MLKLLKIKASSSKSCRDVEVFKFLQCSNALVHIYLKISGLICDLDSCTDPRCVCGVFFFFLLLFQVLRMWLGGLHSVLVSYRVSQEKLELCCRHLVHENVPPMSLVEDILDLLHIVLEYFGVPPDMVSAHMLLLQSCYWFSSWHPGISRGLFTEWICENADFQSRLFFVCVFAFMLLPVAGSSVGQSAVWSVSQHCAHDWDQHPADSYTTCALSGTRITCVF